MAAGINGSDVTLDVRVSVGPDVYVVVGGQRGLDIGRERTAIGTSGKGDGDGYVTGGRRGSTLTMDGLIIESDVGRAALIASFDGDGVGRVRRSAIGAEPARQCNVLINDIEDNFPDDDAGTWTVELTLNGPWTAISDTFVLLLESGSGRLLDEGAGVLVLESS